MIYSISGTLTHKSTQWVVIDTKGVGYQAFMPSSTIDQLPDIGQHIQIYTYLSVREDSHTLYGFSSEDDRQWFTALISVSGVGPKVALNTLSQLSIQDCINAITSGHTHQLTAVTGVGKKMAERMILELKDKWNQWMPQTSLSPLTSSEKPIIVDQQSDTFLAMKTLGYSQEEIKRAFHRSTKELTDGLPLEDTVKILLKHL